MATTIEETLPVLIASAVGAPEDVASYLADDVLWFSAWYKSTSPNEYQYDSSASLKDLIAGGADRTLLARQIKAIVMSETASNIEDIVRLAMDRIVNWRAWAQDAWELDNFKAYAEESDEYNSVYNDSDYGAAPDADNGADGAF